MSKVYVVTSGEYSDYGVDGIFSSEENAKLYMEKFPKDWGGYNDLQEWELDGYVQQIKDGEDFYFVRMNKEGDVSEVKIQTPFSYSVGLGYDSYKNIYQKGMYRSGEHAIKSLNEKRLQILAADKWGDYQFLKQWNNV